MPVAGVSPGLVSRLSSLPNPSSTVRSRMNSEGNHRDYALCVSQRPAGHNPLQQRLKLASLPFPLPAQLGSTRVASLSRKGLLPFLNGWRQHTHASVQSCNFPQSRDLEVMSRRT